MPHNPFCHAADQHLSHPGVAMTGNDNQVHFELAGRCCDLGIRIPLPHERSPAQSRRYMPGREGGQLLPCSLHDLAHIHCQVMLPARNDLPGRNHRRLHHVQQENPAAIPLRQCRGKWQCLPRFARKVYGNQNSLQGQSRRLRVSRPPSGTISPNSLFAFSLHGRAPPSAASKIRRRSLLRSRLSAAYRFV